VRRQRGGNPYRRDETVVVREGWTSSWTPTEAEFQDLFVELATKLGWVNLVHVADSRSMDIRSAPGVADWYICHRTLRRQIWVELKGWGGKARDDQREFVGHVNASGGEAYVVTTSGDHARDLLSLSELLSWTREDVARMARDGAESARMTTTTEKAI
jgi:hypothetical protein